MAPIKKVQVTDQANRQPPTVAAHGAPAPTNAPAQGVVVTGRGPQQKTAPTFNQSPTLKPNPPDNGSVNIINNQRQPAPRGPQAPLGGNGYVN